MEFESKPLKEIYPKRQMKSTHGIYFKSQSTQVESIETPDDDRFAMNVRAFKSCECGESAKSKSVIAESVKQPLTNRIERVSDRAAPSTSESSIDSQSSYGKRLKNRGWSKNSQASSKIPFRRNKKKSRRKESSRDRNNRQQGTFTLWIDSMYFSSQTIERLNGMDTKPYVYLTWTFLELQDKAYSTIMPANKAIFNCSSVYRGDITIEMLHYMCANKVKVECHVALNDSSQMISLGEIDVSEAIYKPNKKCKYKVALDGPNDMSAVISCWFKFDCPETLLRRVLEK